MKDLFEGVYLKHQKNGESICFIAGRAGETRFVQVITNGSVRQYDGAQGFCFGEEGVAALCSTCAAKTPASSARRLCRTAQKGAAHCCKTPLVGKKEGPRESGGFWPGIKGLSHGKERPKIKRSLLPSRKEQTAFGVLQI